jgi:hypothetical protein
VAAAVFKFVVRFWFNWLGDFGWRFLVAVSVKIGSANQSPVAEGSMLRVFRFKDRWLCADFVWVSVVKFSCALGQGPNFLSGFFRLAMLFVKKF